MNSCPPSADSTSGGGGCCLPSADSTSGGGGGGGVLSAFGRFNERGGGAVRLRPIQRAGGGAVRLRPIQRAGGGGGGGEVTVIDRAHAHAQYRRVNLLI